MACWLPGMVGLGIVVFADYREERQRLLNDNMQRARALGHAIDGHILRAQSLVHSFAIADEILSGDVRNFSKRASRAIAGAGLRGHIFVYRFENGRPLLYSSKDDRFVAESIDSAAARLVFERGTSVISDLTIDPDSGHAFVNAHVPVILHGKVTYSAAIAIPTTELTAELLAQSLPSGWLVGLTDRKGIIAGRSRDSDKHVGRPASPQLRAAVLKSDVGTLETITREGIANLTAFSRSPRTGYTTSIGVPQAELIGPLQMKLASLIGTFALVFGLALLLARYMSKRISNSVQALIKPAIALGQGTPIAFDRLHLAEANEVAAAIGRAAELLTQRDRALRAQQEALQQFHFFTENANDILLVLEEAGQIRYANRMASRRLGYGNAELLGMEIFQIDKAATPKLFGRLFEYSRSTQITPFEREYTCNDGSVFPVEINATVLEHSGEWLMYVAPRDISERVQAEQAVRWAATHDAMTGLANRACLRECLLTLLSAEHCILDSGALLYIDLDRFKPVNDVYGHEVGDRVLLEVSQRIQALMRQTDLLARVGGDEFIALLGYRDDGGRHAVDTARSLIDAVSAPIKFGNIEVKLSASIGISRFPEHGDSADVLIHAADLAMLQAKHDGRNGYSFYAPEMDKQAQFAIQVERRLQQALEHGALALHFQPIVNLASGAVDGVEALVRLEDGIEPPLGPAAFIPVAEMCGLIAPLGEWVSLEACRQQGRWRDAGVHLQVSVNVSALQFQRADFMPQIRKLIAVSGINPHWLVVELTETAVMENMAEAVQILSELKKIGIRIALDDFGTGYSGLSVLSNLPIDKLKIDQSFVRRIDTDHASRAVIDAVIALANSLELELVAEGIETESALQYLRERGCQLGQGYYFSRPLPQLALGEWVKKRNAQVADDNRCSS